MGSEAIPDRSGEWFVPSFGPRKLRALIGLLFLPYTGMVLAYTAIGAVLAGSVHWDRVVALILIYFLGLGIGGHALDALGSKAVKPWGQSFSVSTLRWLASSSVATAYAIGLYYILTVVPWLSIIAALEGFFLFAYNLEWFDGRFHRDTWFAVSWGALPVLAGYVMQTNRLSFPPIIIAASMALLSFVEIKASRPYKALVRAQSVNRDGLTAEELEQLTRLESVLKSLSMGVILLGLGLLVWRLTTPLLSR